jgi:hypothetical protein
MKWTLVIRQRHRVAVLLASVMALVLVSVLVERKNIRDISESVTSIYNDRLVPAADIFDLTEEFYNKRFLLEKFLESENVSAAELRSELAGHDQQISKILTRYEKTFLVSEEARGLQEVKSRIRTYQDLERSVIELAETGSGESASAFYRDHARPVLQETLAGLSKLSDVQKEVGGELLKKSTGIAAMSSLLLTAQIILSIVIGTMIVALVQTSKMVASDSVSYHLN